MITNITHWFLYNTPKRTVNGLNIDRHNCVYICSMCGYYMYILQVFVNYMVSVSILLFVPIYMHFFNVKVYRIYCLLVSLRQYTQRRQNPSPHHPPAENKREGSLGFPLFLSVIRPGNFYKLFKHCLNFLTSEFLILFHCCV